LAEDNEPVLGAEFKDLLYLSIITCLFLGLLDEIPLVTWVITLDRYE
jgi:hypothetical protein